MEIEPFDPSELSQKEVYHTQYMMQNMQDIKKSSAIAETQAQSNYSERKAILTTLQRQAYIQYDTILRLSYDIKYAIAFAILLFLVLLTLLLGPKLNIPIQILLGIIAIYTFIFLIFVIILIIKQKKRRSYRFTTRRWNVDESGKNDNCT